MMDEPPSTVREKTKYSPHSYRNSVVVSHETCSSSLFGAAVEFWYDGEIGFFDYYIIPLAKKLKSCGVFGVSSDEYLQYAQQNREEWSLRGKGIVEEYLENLGSQEPGVRQ